MTYDEIHPTLRVAIGTFEGFRKVGFAADDIFVEAAQNPYVGPEQLMVFTLLRTQGKEFRVDAGAWDKDKVPELERQWVALCEAMNARQVPQDDMDRIWQESPAYQRKVEFVTAILRKGIAIPSGGDMPAQFAFPCQFCSGEVTTIHDDNALVHSEPSCATFDDLDVLAFM